MLAEALISEDCERIIAVSNFTCRTDYCTAIKITCPQHDYTAV